ncbi:hypothetical protein O181_015808 [Austropuccinia psidii MF-1]|uniref:Reverse transcriptase domain-containing protein n=1 Tax=Austropuccinia psidii MF-1 TaxID=1389203 RepID=A0A9Q3GQA7_9BASI|nr:hypothetical protein [Austropuccinia psidii MF-1]
MMGEIVPLRHEDGSLTTELEEKATLLFQVPPEEIQQAIENLPNKKAAGSDTIPNELLKLAAQQLWPVLMPLFNTCLARGHYPTLWKTSLTASIQKANKEDYSNPSAYQPIAFLNTLSKLFEKIINNHLTFWSTTKEILHPGHVGENWEGT